MTFFQKLLEAAKPGFERTLFEMAYLTEAREGEFLALLWTDLELPKEGPGRMVVWRTLSWARLKGEATRGPFRPRPRPGAARSRSLRFREPGLGRLPSTASATAALRP